MELILAIYFIEHCSTFRDMSEKHEIPMTTVYRYVFIGVNIIFNQSCKFIQLPQTIEEFQLLSNKSLKNRLYKDMHCFLMARILM